MSQNSAGRTVMVQGRIVWVSGDLFKGQQKKDMNTGRPVFKDNGEPAMQYGFGLAVPKSVLNQVGPGQPGEIWAAIHQEGQSLFPRGLPPSFAMKFKDGDGVDHNGTSFATREGYPGCLVFACTTTIPIKFFKFENGQNFLVNEGIKCGDYVNVQLSIVAHPAIGQGKPGLYLNPNAVQLMGYGKEIVNTPSGDAIFGTMAPPVPAGASAMPMAPQAGLLVPQGGPMGNAMPATFAMPGSVQSSMPSPGISQQIPQMAQAPQAPVQPHYGVLPPNQQPMQAAVPPMPSSMSFPQTPQYGQAGMQPVTPIAPSQPSGFPMPGQPMQQPMGMPMVPGFPGNGQQ